MKIGFATNENDLRESNGLHKIYNFFKQDAEAGQSDSVAQIRNSYYFWVRPAI